MYYRVLSGRYHQTVNTSFKVSTSFTHYVCTYVLYLLQRPVLRVNELKKMGARSALARSTLAKSHYSYLTIVSRYKIA
jgi:hypothetical protein